MDSFRYRMKIAYDGKTFGGWQIQPNAASIQQVIQESLSVILRCRVCLTAAGRTDAGVHAKGQIAHFDTPAPIQNLQKCQRSLNSLLPFQIKVIALEACSSDFHSRYHAVRKIYHYYIHTSTIPDPFYSNYRWFVPHLLDWSLLAQACKSFVGTHDFRAFANENYQGVAAKDSIRTIYSLEPTLIEGGVRLEFDGDGFLYKMVRNCTGLIVDIARARRPLADIGALLKQANRSPVGYCAPAQGLFLEKVFYRRLGCAPSGFLDFISD